MSDLFEEAGLQYDDWLEDLKTRGYRPCRMLAGLFRARYPYDNMTATHTSAEAWIGPDGNVAVWLVVTVVATGGRARYYVQRYVDTFPTLAAFDAEFRTQWQTARQLQAARAAVK